MLPDVAAKLFPNFLTWSAQVTSTLILFIIFRKFLWGPVQSYFATRADFIQKNMTDAKDMRDQAEVFLNESEEQSRAAAKQYRDIIEAAKEDANKQRDLILEEAKQQADTKIAQARAEIEQEKKQAQQEMKEEIVDIATVLATKIIDRELNINDNDQMVQSFIDEVVH